MPSSKNYVRDYKEEAKYHAQPEQKKNRAARNKARAQAVASGKSVSSKDIDHKKPLRSGGSTDSSNTRVRSISANRSDNGHKPGEVQKKKKKGN